MKKAYESPKAEKMNFQYSETVVASNVPVGCINTTVYSHSNQEASTCTSQHEPTWVGDNGR